MTGVDKYGVRIPEEGPKEGSKLPEGKKVSEGGTAQKAGKKMQELSEKELLHAHLRARKQIGITGADMEKGSTTGAQAKVQKAAQEVLPVEIKEANSLNTLKKDLDFVIRQSGKNPDNTILSVKINKAAIYNEPLDKFVAPKQGKTILFKDLAREKDGPQEQKRIIEAVGNNIKETLAQVEQRANDLVKFSHREVFATTTLNPDNLTGLKTWIDSRKRVLEEIKNIPEGHRSPTASRLFAEALVGKPPHVPFLNRDQLLDKERYPLEEKEPFREELLKLTNDIAKFAQVLIKESLEKDQADVLCGLLSKGDLTSVSDLLPR